MKSDGKGSFRNGVKLRGDGGWGGGVKNDSEILCGEFARRKGRVCVKKGRFWVTPFMNDPLDLQRGWKW